jgi:hypothetical protein
MYSGTKRMVRGKLARWGGFIGLADVFQEHPEMKGPEVIFNPSARPWEMAT